MTTTNVIGILLLVPVILIALRVVSIVAPIVGRVVPRVVGPRVAAIVTSHLGHNARRQIELPRRNQRM